MKNNKILFLISIIIVFISLSYFVLANPDFPPDGFPGESCRCKDFCEQDFKCYFGDCTKYQLRDLNCTNVNDLGVEVSAERCPACPACDLWEDCVNEENVFITGEGGEVSFGESTCGDYYQYLINNGNIEIHPYCFQTVMYEAYDFYDDPLNNINLLMPSLVDGIDYSNVFEYYNLYRDAAGAFKVPRCQGTQEITAIATKVGYDADVQTFNITNNKVSPDIHRKFLLALGTCHIDCTDSYNRCNPDCEGFSNDMGGCSYNKTVVNDKNITKMCAYKPVGTEVVLDIQPDNYTLVDCCEGAPRVVSRPAYNIRLVSGRNLVSVQKSVKTTVGEQAKLSIFYWN